MTGQQDRFISIREAIRKTLPSGHQDYTSVALACTLVEQAMLDEIGSALTAAMSRHLSSKDATTLSAKREIVAWINSELAQHGLALTCPVTGRPATLAATFSGAHAEAQAGRYRIRVSDDKGAALWTWSGKELPPLVVQPRSNFELAAHERRMGRE